MKRVTLNGGSVGLDLTVVVLTCDEERNLPDCLRSIEPLGCAVFVVDSGSTDHTLEIARDGGATVFEHPFENYGAQRNWAQDNLPIETSWVLHIDADERLTPELRESISGALAHPPDEVSGYLLRRRTVFLGKWIRHGGHYPSYHARLFRMGKGRCEDRLYDQHYIVEGRVESLPGDMIDETLDFGDWWTRHAKWARSEAQEVVGQGERTGRLEGKLDGTAIEKKRWLRQSVYYRLPWFLRPTLYFMYRYFVRLGFLDGWQGSKFHFLQGFWYRFKVDAFILQMRLGFGPSEQATLPESSQKQTKTQKTH